MEFRLLGGVEGRLDDQAVDLGPARQRYVLAVLLLDVNRVVSLDKMVDRVWDGHPPPSLRNTLHSYVSRLRKVLAATGEIRILQQSGGYLLTADQFTVDLHRFRRLVTDAHAATNSERALALFEQAVDLWRGEPFAGLNTFWSVQMRDSLEQERFAAQLDLIDAALRSGHHAATLPLLSNLAGNRPMDERLAGQLMLALHRNGRQADALNHYHQIRRRLAEELGIDPSPTLQRLHHHVLTADPAVATPSRAAGAPDEPRSGWLQRSDLPRDIADFTGRADELRRLHTPSPAGSVAWVKTIDGMAGVGKPHPGN